MTVVQQRYFWLVDIARLLRIDMDTIHDVIPLRSNGVIVAYIVWHWNGEILERRMVRLTKA